MKAEWNTFPHLCHTPNGDISIRVYCYLPKGQTNELPILFVIKQIKVYLIDDFNHFVPPRGPTFHWRMILTIGTGNEGIKQSIGTDEAFLDGAQAHTHIITFCST